MQRIISGAAVGIAALGLAACAGNGDGLDANGRPQRSGNPAEIPLVAGVQIEFDVEVGP